MAKKRVLCEYDECKLPKNNKKYLCQAGYMTVAALGLAIGREQLNAVAILLFVTPVFFDFTYNKDGINNRWFKQFCWAGMFANFIVGLFCFGVLFNVIIDTGVAFVTNPNSLMFPINIKKEFILLFCCFDVFGPVAFYRGCISQETVQSVTA